MIELKNLEIKMVSGGMYYYTALGTVLGSFATTGWFLSMADTKDFSQTDPRFMVNIILIFGTIGAAFGSVVGYAIDNAGIN